MVNTPYLLHRIDSELLRLNDDIANVLSLAEEQLSMIENNPRMEAVAKELLDNVVKRMEKYVRLTPSSDQYQN